MAENDNTFLNADSIYEDVEGESGKTLNLEIDQKQNLVGIINGRYAQAEDARQTDETRWLKAYENYRGLYKNSVKFRDSEKSRIFVKITKTKVLAAFGQLVDVIFGTGKFPIGISETKLPEGEKENAYLDTQNPTPSIEITDENRGNVADPFDVGFEGDGRVLGAGATYNKVESIEEQANDMLASGLSAIPDIPEISPAEKAARRMEKLIHDQIEESNGSAEIRNALLEAALLGTGIVKGPFNFNKKLHQWSSEGDERNYNPLEVRVPRIEFVSCWDFYPDPSATNIEECEYIVHRHKMNKSQLRQLRNMPYFDEEAIRSCLQMGANYVEKDFESQLKDDNRSDESYASNFEVLEYWGMCDTEMLIEQEIDIPKDLQNLDELQVNVWICNGKLLRMVLNPFKPATIPYMAAPYELNPYSFFGVGIAENMDDTQTLMNGFMRMAIDNAALSGNLIIEVDETNLVPGQDMSVYPGKVFRRQGGAPGQALFGTKFPNVAGENMQLFDKARVLADESSGFPSFAHGQTGVQGVGRTASGISMLMNAANGSIRSVVKNVDDYLIGPLGKAFYSFNMQFDFDETIKGDLEIKAQGTNSCLLYTSPSPRDS